MVLHKDSSFWTYQNLIFDLEYEQVQRAPKCSVHKGYFKGTDSMLHMNPTFSFKWTHLAQEEGGIVFLNTNFYSDLFVSCTIEELH